MKFICYLLFFVLLLGSILTTPVTACASTYTVAPKDSLFAISMRYGITVQTLMDLNQLTCTLIKPGQQLKVPAEKAPDENNTLHQTIKNYIVKSGDSLNQIAYKNNTTVQALMTVNNLSGFVINPDQVLIIPSNSGQTTNNIASRQMPNTGIAYTSEELDLLARLIAAESRGESNTAKVGVGAVVVNRVLSPKFPNTIKGVIYQPKQFGPARTGRINNPAPEDCIIAAKEALRGIDPTGGALFFTDISSRCGFLHSLPVAYTDGKMIFFKAK